MTNASFNLTVGILLMPKHDVTEHKKYTYTLNLRRNAMCDNVWHFDFFNKTVGFVLATMMDGTSMKLKSTFCLHVVKHLIVSLRCAVNVTTSFQVQYFYLHVGHVTSYELSQV